MNKLNNKTVVHNGKWPGRNISTIYIFVLSFLLLTACDRTVQYKELRIVTVDKLGTMEENKEIPVEALDKLQFFLYHEGKKINFYPKKISLERLDNPNDDEIVFEEYETSKGRFSKKRPEKVSQQRNTEIEKFLAQDHDFFKPSTIIFTDQLDSLDNFIYNSEENSEQILIYNEFFWGEDTTLNGIEFENLHFKADSVYNHIESLLMETNKDQELLDDLSIVIILIPEGKLTPDTISITYPTRLSGVQRNAQLKAEDGSYEGTFGPFEANIPDPDSITWIITGSFGYKIEPQKGKSETKINIETKDLSGTGLVRILVTPHKAGMYSQPEEIDVTFNKIMGELVKSETDNKAKSDKDKQAQIARDQQSKAERERQAQIQRDQQAKAAREKQAQNERDQQSKAERDKQAQIEREKQAKAERDRQAQIERDKQAKAERERQAQIEKDQQAKTINDPCPPVSEIISLNDQRQNIIEDFITEINHIWGSSDPANIPLYKEEAKKAIAMIPAYKVECSLLGNNLDRFLNELAAKNLKTKPEIQSRFDDCGIIDGIVIKIN